MAMLWYVSDLPGAVQPRSLARSLAGRGPNRCVRGDLRPRPNATVSGDEDPFLVVK